MTSPGDMDPSNYSERFTSYEISEDNVTVLIMVSPAAVEPHPITGIMGLNTEALASLRWIFKTHGKMHTVVFYPFEMCTLIPAMLRPALSHQSIARLTLHGLTHFPGLNHEVSITHWSMLLTVLERCGVRELEIKESKVCQACLIHLKIRLRSVRLICEIGFEGVTRGICNAHAQNEAR
ncbi:hypothetical protein K461DRAFT_270659 [Myriangium duriaei CBS 260.36]|uniref:Uncharacterized protein n=1 Tax=Myriangium duriaei CBS 260.36 TaxID=1168546 RepID=A0A9P4IX84_9PEZI|nr:hypothetical protein K461DRAFT_270659 [Myriangium duriaei CBS 260.36]